VLLFSVKRV